MCMDPVIRVRNKRYGYGTLKKVKGVRSKG
jgi:hypothetical protein